jgi:hypothetical protein
MEDGDFALVRGCRERRTSGELLRRVHTERGSSAARASDKAHLVGEDEAAAGQAEVGGESNPACVSACKKRAFFGSSDGRERRKRVCPSSIFVEIRPF